jgi:acyl-CoA thioesterase I
VGAPRLLLQLLPTLLLLGCASRIPSGFEDLPGVHVAALGDSITYGYGLSADEAWPALLQESLGEDYAVVNFGRSGANALEAGQWPYSGLAQHDDALRFEPVIVVSMLGTNDSRAEYWDADDYRRDHGAMLDGFAALESVESIHLAWPPPAWDNDFLIRGDVIAAEVLPAIDALGAERGWPVIDAHAAFDDAALMQDGVHPTAEGAALIADAVTEALLARR